MTITDIETAVLFLNSAFNNILFNTILALGFNGLHRPWELVEPDAISLGDDRKLIKQWSFTIAKDGSYAHYTLSYSKTNPLFCGCPVLIPPRPNSLACPIVTVMRFAVIRNSAFPTNHFLLLRSNGYIQTRSWFMKQLKQVFGSNLLGHSMRAGGATAYAQSGVRMEVILSNGKVEVRHIWDIHQGEPSIEPPQSTTKSPFPKSGSWQ